VAKRGTAQRRLARLRWRWATRVLAALTAASVAFGLTAVGVVGAAAESDSVVNQGSPAQATGPSGDADGNTVLGSSPAVQMQSAGDSYIVAVEDSAALLDVTSDLTAQGISVTNTWDGELTGLTATLDDAARDALEARDDIVAVEPDQPIELSGTQTGAPWNLDRLDQRILPLDSTYSYTETGLGVTAYVIDSGIRLTHQDFAGRIGPGAYWDFGDGTGISDCNGHGTHVAGTVGGTTWGVAKQVTITPVKVFPCSGPTSMSIVLEGMNWVIGDHASGTPAVVNLSVGGAASTIIDDAANRLIADGITVVTAAGNDAAPTCSFSPARVPAAITVAASDINDGDAWFTNHGSCNDIFAPGVGIRSASHTDDTGSLLKDGTSMAAPHVTGDAALILQRTPQATPAQVWQTMSDRATRGAISECCGDPDLLLAVPAPPPSGGLLRSLVPARLLDTRPGNPTVDGTSQGLGRQPAGSTLQLTVEGRGGVPAGVEAVMLNVTVVSPATGGHLTVFPCGSPQPVASNLNFVAGQVVPNAVLAKIGTGGQVCLFTSAATDIVADVNGYVPAGGSPSSVVPARLLDTRPGNPTVDGAAQGLGRQPANSTLQLTVTGRGGVPAGAEAAILNVTAVSPSSGGYLTVFPCASPQPVASSLNFVAGQVVPNLVLAKVGTGGKVCLYTTAAADLVVDVDGFVLAGGSPSSVVPARLLDTRPGNPTVDGMAQGLGRRPADSTLQLTVTGRGGVPAGAEAVILNVTAVSPSSGGYLTVFPCGSSRPLASNLNVVGGEIVPNAVLAKVGTDGKVCLYTSAATDIVADVNGFV
jgi:subtilisin family serine protease